MSTSTTLVWLRRDLRLGDNPALTAGCERAGSREGSLLPVFVWEEPGRRPWSPGAAARWWLWRSLAALDGDLRRRGSRLAVVRGDPAASLPRLAAAAQAGAVVWAAGLDPAERADDEAVASALRAAGIGVRIVPSANLLYDAAAVRTRAGGPYTVFTPFWRRCLEQPEPAQPLPAPSHLPTPPASPPGVSLDELAGDASRPWASTFDAVWTPGEAGAHARLRSFLKDDLDGYAELRDRPDLDGSSRLSPHLRWGEVGARQVWHAVAGRLAESGRDVEAAVLPIAPRVGREATPSRSAAAFLRQLGWREFGHHLLAHFPQLAAQPLDRRFLAFPWRDDPEDLAAWQQGRTGYPLVDAGMRQLWATGWMHNRARLVAASFLVKDLLLPWQSGEAWFWDTLVDADLANNALGWQWVAGCGADAAPYFRIFNPLTQAQRYDPHGEYTAHWLPADEALEPVVNHAAARRRALSAYEAMRQAP